MTEPNERELKPGLLECALLMLDDACPPEQDMQVCRMQDCDDGECCSACWRRYLFYVSNGRRMYSYRHDWIYEDGMIG